MTLHGRRAWAIVSAALLTGLFLLTGAMPAQAHRGGALPQPAITFPNGPEVTAGGTLTVTFDAGGDRRVTGFRYSLDSPTLDQTGKAAVRGGRATVSLDVGAISGDRPLFAVAVGGHGRTSALTQATISVTQTVPFSGTVLNGITWLPAPGATVTLEPGGLQATADSNGAFAFTGVPSGVYTATATVGGTCPASSSQTLLIDGQGLYFEFYLFPAEGEACSAGNDNVLAARPSGR